MSTATTNSTSLNVSAISHSSRGSRICCFPGCANTNVSPNINLFKIPNGKHTGRYGSSAKVKKWSDDFCAIIYRYRSPNDNNLKTRLECGNVWICSIHFDDDDICRTTKRTWLHFGALPKYFLPKKSHESSNMSKPSRKKIDRYEAPLQLPSSTNCGYSTTSEVESAYLSLVTIKSWQMNTLSLDGKKDIHFTLWEKEHAQLGIPLYSVYVNDNLSFLISVLGIPLPANHELYNHHLIGPNASSLHSLLSMVCEYKHCNGYINSKSKPWIALVQPRINQNVGSFSTRFVVF